MIDEATPRRGLVKLNTLVLLVSLSTNAIVLLNNLVPIPERWPNARQVIRYAVSEWLINYSGGFVRRGLVGEIVDLISRNTGFAPHVIAMAAGASLTLVVIAILFATLMQLRNQVGFLPFAALSFSPLLLGFYLSDLQILGRRDQLGFILTFLHLVILSSYASRDTDDYLKDRYVRDAGILFLLFGVPATLLHESILFLSLPLNVTLSFFTLRHIRQEKNPLFWIMLYGPLLVAGTLCLLHHGNSEIVNHIKAYWLRRGEDPVYVSMRGNQIDPLSMTSTEALQDFPRFFLHAAPVFVVLIASNFTLLRWALGALPWRSHMRWASLDLFEQRFLVLPFVASVPLYLIAIDWGRWLAMLFSQFFLLSVWSGRIPFIQDSKIETKPVKSRVGLSFIAATFIFLAFRVPFLYAGWAGPPWGTLPRFLLMLASKQQGS